MTRVAWDDLWVAWEPKLNSDEGRWRTDRPLDIPLPLPMLNEQSELSSEDIVEVRCPANVAGLCYAPKRKGKLRIERKGYRPLDVEVQPGKRASMAWVRDTPQAPDTLVQPPPPQALQAVLHTPLELKNRPSQLQEVACPNGEKGSCYASRESVRAVLEMDGCMDVTERIEPAQPMREISCKRRSLRVGVPVLASLGVATLAVGYGLAAPILARCDGFPPSCPQSRQSSDEAQLNAAKALIGMGGIVLVSSAVWLCVAHLCRRTPEKARKTSYWEGGTWHF